MYSASAGGRRSLSVTPPQTLEVDALHELHRQEELVRLGAAEVEHLHDVRVRQLHRQPHLVEEARDELRDRRWTRCGCA